MPSGPKEPDGGFSVEFPAGLVIVVLILLSWILLPAMLFGLERDLQEPAPCFKTEGSI